MGVASSCRSLSKPELEKRLRSLAKNAEVRELSRERFRADLGDGEEEYELVYHHAPRESGSGGVPLVLVHGTPSTLFSWSELIHGGEGFAGLARNHDVYAFEVIGHGIAPGDHAPYTFEKCARFLVEGIRALGLGHVHLIGSSYGGEFVWRAALNAPELIQTVVLMDSSGLKRRDGDWLPEEVEMRENGLAKIGWIINSRERITTALAPHFRRIPPDRVEEFFLVCENASNWRAMVELARDENGQREAELAELSSPTLLLWGEDDRAYTPRHYGRRFAETIPDARLVTLPETGHYPHEERPAEVVQLLNDFIAEHASR